MNQCAYHTAPIPTAYQREKFLGPGQVVRRPRVTTYIGYTNIRMRKDTPSLPGSRRKVEQTYVVSEDSVRMHS